MDKNYGHPVKKRLWHAEMVEEVTTSPVQKGDGDKASLQKEFTVTSGIAVIVGQIIGSGIFITPRSILHYGGSFGVCVLMWLAGALISMCGGLCYIELGLLVKRGGGESGYLLEAYSLKNLSRWSELLGSMLSFLFVWNNVWIMRPASLAVQSLTCAHYVSRPFYGEDDIPEYIVKAIALGVLGKVNFFFFEREAIPEHNCFGLVVVNSLAAHKEVYIISALLTLYLSDKTVYRGYIVKRGCRT